MNTSQLQVGQTVIYWWRVATVIETYEDGFYEIEFTDGLTERVHPKDLRLLRRDRMFDNVVEMIQVLFEEAEPNLVVRYVYANELGLEQISLDLSYRVVAWLSENPEFIITTGIVQGGGRYFKFWRKTESRG